MGKRQHLYAFGTFVKIENIQTMSIAVLETSTKGASVYFLCQFLVPCVLGCGHGHPAVNINRVDAVSRIGSSGNGHIHFLGLVPRCRFLQLKQ